MTPSLSYQLAPTPLGVSVDKVWSADQLFICPNEETQENSSVYRPQIWPESQLCTPYFSVPVRMLFPLESPDPHLKHQCSWNPEEARAIRLPRQPDWWGGEGIETLSFYTVHSPESLNPNCAENGQFCRKFVIRTISDKNRTRLYALYLSLLVWICMGFAEEIKMGGFDYGVLVLQDVMWHVIYASPILSKIQNILSLIPQVPVKGLWPCCFIMYCVQAGRSSPDHEADGLLKFIERAFPTLCGQTWCLEFYHWEVHSLLSSLRGWWNQKSLT